MAYIMFQLDDVEDEAGDAAVNLSVEAQPEIPPGAEFDDMTPAQQIAVLAVQFIVDTITAEAKEQAIE